VTRVDATTVRRVADVGEGELVRVRVSDGTFDATITSRKGVD
jgi:exonuclease VII large subunit